MSHHQHEDEHNRKNKDLYTLGIWTVKPGKEEEFIREWESFAVWTGENMPGPGKARLMQDQKNHSKFISFGPWNDESDIQKWRDSEEFRKFFEKSKNLCDEVIPNTMKVVATSDSKNK